HYPQEKADAMISHLCSLAQSRIILSFAPKTCALTILKKIGSFFPGASKATRAYLHREADVVKILEKNGFVVQRQSMTRTRFYFSRLLEAKRK
ncbi:MAG: magnesium protoporphyrin IX methyltransferase, partial [Mastigocladus sp. ERB_26_1]